MKSRNSKYKSRPPRNTQLIKKRSLKPKKNGERLESIFRASPDAIIVIDLDGRIVDCNQAALEMCGVMRKEELISRAALDFITEKDRPGAMKVLKDLLQLGTVRNLETKLLDSTGHEYPAEISCSVVEDNSGKPVSFVAIYKDITERKKAEAAFTNSENRYKSVVDNIAIGVSLISPKMEILALNRQMENWFPDIDVSKNPTCYKAFNNPPRDEVCSYCPTYKTLKDGQVHESITNTPRKDKTINFRVVSSPIRDEEGQVVGAIEMVDDVTERMRLEQELKLYSQNLEAVVQERTHKLTESEEHFRSLFENVPDGIYRSSPSGKILTANQALVRMFGYGSLEEFLTIDIARDLYVNKKDRLAWQKKLEKDGELQR